MTQDHSHLAVEGELSIFTAAPLRERLIEALDAGTAVDVDLSAVTEMDSAGLQLVLAARKQAQAQGKTLNFVRCSDAVIDILQLCGLGELAAAGQEAGDRP